MKSAALGLLIALGLGFWGALAQVPPFGPNEDEVRQIDKIDPVMVPVELMHVHGLVYAAR